MPKKIPLRKCIVCRESYPKNELIRFVKNDEGVFIDLTGKMQGRGAYVCKSPECIQKCIKKRAFDHIFGVKLDDEIYKNLQNQYDELTKN